MVMGAVMLIGGGRTERHEGLDIVGAVWIFLFGHLGLNMSRVMRI